MKFETTSLLIGALVLILTLVVCYMALLLYKPPSEPGPEEFLTRHHYRPACGNKWIHARRENCKGLTRGHMPFIDDPYPHSPSFCNKLTGAMTHTPVHPLF